VRRENLQELVKKQAKLIDGQTETIKKFEARIAGLEGQVLERQTAIAYPQKDTHNSSKAPSSDILKTTIS
jgi:hypothetical protein